jgi:YbbR domain-containing protein
MMDRLLQNNAFVKIIASFLAILLWLVVHSENGPLQQTAGIAQMSQTLYDKPVTVLLNERDVSLVGEPTVVITLRGSVIDVMKVMGNASSFQVVADAWQFGEGVHTVQAYPRGLPQGVTMDPVTATINLEANVNRELPIKLVTEGEPKEGLSVGESLVTPKTVIISGAKSAVDSVDKVVATINISDKAETIQTSVPLIAVDKAGKPIKGVHMSDERAEVNIPIVKPSKSVSLALQFKGDPAPGFAVESVVQPPNITIFGTPKALGSVDSYPSPILDLTGLSQSKKYPLQLALIDGISAIQPQQVEIEVKVTEAVERTFTGIPVKITGLKQGESYELAGTTGDKVDITVSGAKKLIDKMTAEDLNVFIDLTNQPAGQQDMRVQVTAPNFIKLVKAGPETLSIDVKK